MPGQILGDRYEVEQQLGRTSGRWTLLARDLITEDPVILKLLFIDEALQPNQLKLFQREVAVLKAIDHPAIPRYLGYFEIELPNDGKAMALIETFVEGESLERSLRNGQRLSEAEAIALAKATLEILNDLHQRQPAVVHRDIKPSNILRCAGSPLPVRLVDFGSIKSLQVNKGSSFTLVGTEGYMPPEQMGGRAVKASDLYSLAATLIAAMSSTQPAQLPRLRGRIDFEQVLSLSPAFAQWLKQMTEPDLEQRFAAADQALRSLHQVSVSAQTF